MLTASSNTKISEQNLAEMCQKHWQNIAVNLKMQFYVVNKSY